MADIDVLDLESLVLDDFPDQPVFRPIPGGRLLVTAQEYRQKESARTGTKGYEIIFTIDALAGGQNDEGVDLSRGRIYHTFWFTHNTVKRIKEEMFTIAPNLKGQGLHLPQLVESLMGRQVYVETELATKDWQGKTMKYPRHEIVKFETYAD